jgi:hypothetical protein
LRNAASENFEFLAICLDRFWKYDFVYAKGRFVEDDFGLGLWGKINGLGNEEVHQRQNTGIYESADSKCEFEAKILDYEPGNKLAVGC